MAVTWTAAERAKLRSVVAAARTELRDREAEDVPPRLRKVAASSARTLPPPLEKALVDALVQDDDFRAAVAERWEASDAEPIGARFLDDPEAARPLAAAAVAHDAERADTALAEAKDRRIADLERQLAEAKERMAALRTRQRDDLASQRAADRAAREGLVDRVTDAEQRTADLEGELGVLRAERDALATRVEHLTERLGDAERRRRTDAGGAPAPVASSVAATSDPRRLARDLDRLERMARPYRRPEGVVPEDAPPAPFALPSGVPPDSAEAVDAVVDAEVDLIVLDGYNLAGTILTGAFHGRAGRERVAQVATMLRRRSGARVVVVYDAVDVEGRAGRRSDLGIEVVFAQDRTADDEIVSLVAAAAAATVVVTNDRELRERSAGQGAVAIWSDAVAAWSNP